MKVDLNYAARANKKNVQDWWVKVGSKSPESAISVIADSTKIPCIVISFWIGEIEDWPPFIMDKIEVLKKFYGYTTILNIPESYPGDKT